jgi:hypothetical protein
MKLESSSYLKSDNLMTRRIAGETLIVPIRGRVGDLDSIYTLNDIGSTIWQLIDGRRPVSEIAEAISDEYEVTAEEAARDIMLLIESLQEAGLVQALCES